MKLTIIKSGSMGDALRELSYTPNPASFLGEGVMGAVYRDDSGKYALKVARATTSADKMEEEYNLLVDMATHIKGMTYYLGLPNLPIPPVALAEAEDGSRILVMYLYDQKRTLVEDVQSRLDRHDYIVAEQASVHAAIRYTYAMEALMACGHACTDRKMKDWMVHSHADGSRDTVVLDWNVLKPHEQTYHAAEIAVFGNLWNELFTQRIAGQNLQILDDSRFGEMSLGLRLILKACVDTPEDQRFINPTNNYPDHGVLRKTLEAWMAVLNGTGAIEKFLDTLPQIFWSDVFPTGKSGELITALQADLAWRKTPNVISEERRDATLATLNHALTQALSERIDAVKRELEGKLRDSQFEDALNLITTNRQQLFMSRKDLMLWGHLGRWQIAVQLRHELQNDYTIQRYVIESIQNDLLFGICQTLHNDPVYDTISLLEQTQGKLDTLINYLAITASFSGRLDGIKAEVQLRLKAVRSTEAEDLLQSLPGILVGLRSEKGIASGATTTTYYDIYPDTYNRQGGLLGATFGENIALQERFDSLVRDKQYDQAITLYTLAVYTHVHPKVAKFTDANRERIEGVRYLRDHTPLKSFQRESFERGVELWKQATPDQNALEKVINAYIEQVKVQLHNATTNAPISAEAFTRAYSNADWVQGFLKREDLITKEAMEIAELIKRLRTLSFISLEQSPLEQLQKIMDTLKQAQDKGLDMDEVMGAGAQQGWQALLESLTAKVAEMQQIATAVSNSEQVVQRAENAIKEVHEKGELTKQEIQSAWSQAQKTIQQAQTEWGTAKQEAIDYVHEAVYAQGDRLSERIDRWAEGIHKSWEGRFQQFENGIKKRTQTVDDFYDKYTQLESKVSDSVIQSRNVVHAMDELVSHVDKRIGGQNARLESTLAQMYRNRLACANAQRSTPPAIRDINALIDILWECPDSIWRSSGVYNDWLQAMRGIEASLTDSQKRKKIDPKQKDSKTYQTFLDDLKREADAKGSSQPNAQPRKPQPGFR